MWERRWHISTPLLEKKKGAAADGLTATVHTDDTRERACLTKSGKHWYSRAPFELSSIYFVCS
jgi:hypothetical protein